MRTIDATTNRRFHRPTSRMGLGALAFVLVLAGCSKSTNTSSGGPSPSGGSAASGSSGSSGSTTISQDQMKSILTSAVLKTEAAGSADLTISSSVTASASATSTATDITGAVNCTQKAVQVSFNAASMGGQAQVLEVGGVFYMNIPTLSTELSAKPWLKIDPKEMQNLTGPMASFASVFSGLEQQVGNPCGYLGFLDAVTGTVTQVGTEQVGAASTTHYSFTADLTKAGASLPSDLASPLAAIESQLGGADTQTDVWIDGQGRLRQLKTQSSAGGSATSVVQFTNYGTNVNVTAPPAGQTSDLASLMNSLGSLGSG